MEQINGQCWSQTKRKYSTSSSNIVLASSTSNSCYGDSWEEQAFAEDAAAASSLGGCIWPPRSYSCSFCRREFRSAQALGGHMNVHRKDRARLKQQPQIDDQILLHHQHLQNTADFRSSNNSLAFNNNLFPNPPLCGLLFKKTNPNHDLDNFVSSTSSPSSASKAVFRDETLTSHFSSSESWLNLHGDDKRLCSTRKYDQVDNIDKKAVSNGRMECSRLRGKKGSKNDQSDDVAMSLNLVLCPLVEQDFNFNHKRMKIDSSSKPITFDDKQKNMQANIFEFSPNSSIEELDLELRLGTS